MRSLNGTYLLSMVDHKASYNGLIIAKWMENNLRERNPQLGRVEVLPAENELSLEIGDLVAVHHFTFYGDIGADKRYKMQDHTEVDGNKLFRVPAENIYFKYPSLEPVGENLLCTDVADIKSLQFHANEGTFSWLHRFSNIGTLDGRKVITKAWAFYCIEIEQKFFFKARKSEVVAYLEPLEPTENCIVVEYLPDPLHPIYNIPFNTVRATVVNGNGYYENGTILLVWRNNGVTHEDKWILDINDEIIIGVISGEGIGNLKVVA